MFKKIALRALVILRSFIGSFSTFHEVSILVYHSISATPVETAVSREQFVRHLEYLVLQGATFVSLRAVLDWHRNVGALPARSVALTFDDGYTDFETTVLPLLEKYNATATLFVLGDEERARSRLHNDIPLLGNEAVNRLQTHPLVTIGYHSRSHSDVSKLSGNSLKEECRSPFTAFFAYPGGVHSQEARAALLELGYDAAFSLKPELVKRSSDPMVMPRNIVVRDMPLWEIEARTTKAIDWYRTLRKFFKPYRKTT